MRMLMSCEIEIEIKDSSDVLKLTKREGIVRLGQEEAMGKYSFICYFGWPLLWLL